ncbi:MAG: hypothetical protein ACREMJ_10110 [Gemmatimonadales bacterium]
MTRILISIILALLFGAASAQAQTRVSVSVRVATPHVSGHVVLGRPYYHRHPRAVVVLGAPRVYAHSSRVIVVPRGHVHRRHHHRHHRGLCGGGYGCR